MGEDKICRLGIDEKIAVLHTDGTTAAHHALGTQGWDADGISEPAAVAVAVVAVIFGHVRIDNRTSSFFFFVWSRKDIGRVSGYGWSHIPGSNHSFYTRQTRHGYLN